MTAFDQRYFRGRLNTNNGCHNAIQYNCLFTHAASRSNKNWLKHMRETKSVEKKRNNLKLPFLNLSKNLLL